MKKTFIWLVASLLFIVVGCVEELHESGIAETSSGQLPNLTAGFAEEETKTYVESGKYLRWHEDDRLTAFFGNTLNRQYKFNGATGDNSGSFSYVPSGNLETGNALDHIYAVYPYDETATITDDGQISLTIHAVQTYAVNSFGRGANTMIAVTENVEDTFLGFKNACGYLKLKLYNPDGATIKSIEVKGNGDEKIAGAATATIAFGEVPQLTMADDATATITIDCGDGVALGTTAEAATEFWVVIPETTFEGGITITVTDTEGGIFEKSTTNKVVIERNAVQPMAALEYKGIKPQPNNEIWYTATSKVTPNATNVFGANIVSNTYDAEKGCWVIKFDGDVTKIGDGAFTLCTKLTSITIPDSVTKIGEFAFNRCDNLTSITIPNSVTAMGNGAFAGCYSLASITIPDGVTTLEPQIFLSCTSLISVIIPNSVTTIKNSFYECTSLTSITIPDSVTTIGDHAFYNCSSLTSITISNSLTTIGDHAFYNCSSLTFITIPDSVTTIGKSAFYNCSRLTSVNIPNGVTTIGDSAFSNCSSLTSVNIPYSVTTIGDQAFWYCSSLTSVTIPESVTTIGDGAFCGCKILASVTIGDSVTTIGDRAFYDCDKLKSVYCRATTPPNLGSYAFSTWAYNIEIYVPTESVDAYKSASGWSEYASYIKSYNFKPEKNEIWYTNGSTTEATTPYRTNAFGANIISNTYDTEKGCWVIKFDGDVTTIGYEAFNGCRSLTRVTIPDSVTSIGEFAFLRCSSLIRFNSKNASEDGRCLIIDGTLRSFAPAGLSEYIIPDGITTIGPGAFHSSNLTSVTIPDGVTTIGNFAFANCSSLTSITIPDGVTTIGMSAFDVCSSLSNVTIPNSVREILSGAFWECSSLTSINLQNVSTIGGSAFRDCSSLTSVTLQNVSTIGDYAFEGCGSLTSVYCRRTYPPEGGGSMFENNASGRKIYVPTESVTMYKSAEWWSEYASSIVGYEFNNYTVTLNNAWRKSTSVSNPDSSLYDGVYESYSNYNVNDGVATMYIDIVGYDTFTIYVRSNAESNYDYVTVYNLDSTSSAKMTTKGNQQSGTSISSYTPVTFSNIGGGSHRITVKYSKDYSQHSGADRGYLIIPKNH